MTADHDFEELMEPAQAADKLSISVATLRKYSLIVEQVTGDSAYFVRTKQKTRLYSEQNITDLRDFKRLSKEASLTLKEAANQIYAIQNTDELPGEPVVNPENLNQGQVVELLKMLQSTITQQNKAINGLQKQVAAVQTQNQQLLDAQKVLTEPTNYQTELDLDAQANLKIKGAATAVGSDDIPDLEEEIAAKAPQDISQKLADIESADPTDPRAEMLIKAVENNEPDSKPQFRTLADMQLPKEKAHWWTRFLE